MRHEETRLGAVFDIVSDRACTALCLASLLVLEPAFAPALAVYFVQFMVVDTVLTLAFLRWPIVSPNHFARVDRMVWLLNWSVPAKTANTTALIVILFALGVQVATVLAVAQLAVKLWSAWRVAGLTGRVDRAR